MGGNLNIFPWPPAQPDSQAPLVILLPGPGLALPITSIPQGPPDGCSLTASTPGLSSPVYTRQSVGSF